MMENAVPTRQRPFVMHGEKREAHIKVTQDWLDHKLMEKPPEGVQIEWLSQTFVVPKKSADFPLRGVGDM